jgi:hypothetical protein
MQMIVARVVDLGAVVVDIVCVRMTTRVLSEKVDGQSIEMVGWHASSVKRVRAKNTADGRLPMDAVTVVVMMDI